MKVKIYNELLDVMKRIAHVQNAIKDVQDLLADELANLQRIVAKIEKENNNDNKR